MREQVGQLFVKFHVMGDDRGDGGCHGFFDIALCQAGFQTCPRLIGGDKDNTHRFAIGACRSQYGQVPRLFEQVRINRFVLPDIVRSAIVEKKVKSLGIKHDASLVELGG